MGSASIARYAEYVKNVFEILADEPEGLQAKEVLARLEKRIELSDFERDEYPSTPGQRRFDKLVRFATIPVVKTGWLLKEKGTWVLTEDGHEALKEYPTATALYDEVRRRYKQWEEARTEEKGVEGAGDEVGEDASASVTLEEAEEDAWKEIEAYLTKVPPYDFQRLVGGLLAGMGYHVAWIAPHGKDGGVDIVAHRDPLGAERPRIKVQVKRTDKKVDVDGLRSFLAVLRDQDVGLFVCVSGFTKDAEAAARQDNRQVTLIGPKELFDLWVRHYDRIPEGARGLLPLKPVWFLAPAD